MSNPNDPEFHARRDAVIRQINAADAATLERSPRRDSFFDTVYDRARGDAAMVPWADLKPKQQLLDWLEQTLGKDKRAIDIGCGLGDNAEALANAGYRTTAFDFSSLAITWAKQRFPETDVRYHTANLFNLPEKWRGGFDLVHECYTLQSIPPETLATSKPAITSLLAPGGTLLVYTRIRPDGSPVEGPPWPLEETRATAFGDFGLVLQTENRFEIEKSERRIPHVFSVWSMPA